MMPVSRLHYFTFVHILILQLFHAVGHNHSAHSVTLCGTSVQIHQEALLFSCMNTFQFYGFPFMNEVTKMVFVCEMHAHFLYMYSHLMVTFMYICHILSNIYSISWPHLCLVERVGEEEAEEEEENKKRKEKEVMTSGVMLVYSYTGWFRKKGQ